MPRIWSRALAALVLLAALSGCDGDDDGGALNNPPPNPPGGGGGSTLNAATVSGRLVAPDGSTPLANALVYIEGSEIAGGGVSPLKAPLAVPAPDVCGTPPTAGWSYTCSAADGSFTWDGKIPANAKLVAIKGAFRIEQVLSATGGAVALGNLAVPTGTPGAPGTTRMAVVTGSYDSVQNVLAKLGFGSVDANGFLQLGTETFDLYDGTGGGLDPTKYKSFDALFQDADSNGKADIFNYAIVFLNCGLDESASTDPTRLQVLRDYVTQGGRLYVSDLAYDFVEQVFPGYVDFEGSPGTAAASAETPGAAELGNYGITSDATLDPALRSWLGTVTCGAGASCLNAGGTATIEGFLGGWAVMVGAHASAPGGVRVWVNGPVTFEGQTTAVSRPLTVAFGVGTGRVTYTSYHNEPFGAAGFVPVERILQFLVFEL